MPSTKADMFKALERNAQKACSVPHCSKMRRGLTPLCSAHETKRRRYGSPFGRAIAQKEYLAELREVRRFLADQESHPAVVAAIAWLSKWLDEASRKEAIVGNYIFGRLHGRLITPQDILAEVSATWRFAQRNPLQLPDDERLTFALARHVLRLATYERRYYGKGEVKNYVICHPNTVEVRDTGERLRGSLARFFVNLMRGLDAKDEQLKNFTTDLGTPFVL